MLSSNKTMLKENIECFETEIDDKKHHTSYEMIRET